MSEIKIGEILLAQKIITPEQLREALEEQNNLSPQPLLGKLLVRLGYVQEQVLQQLLDRYEKRRSFAEVLVAHNYLTQEDLDVALKMSGNELLPLDRVLLNLDFITEETLARAIATFADLPYAHLDNSKSNVKTGLANAIMAYSPAPQKMVPTSIDGRIITIAMNRPLPQQELRRLEALIKLKVLPVIVPENEIAAAQKRFSILPGYGNVKETGLKLPEDIVTMIADEIEGPEAEQEEQLVTESDSFLVKLVNKIIYDACQLKASDIHIEPYPGKKEIIVRMRVDGKCSIYRNYSAPCSLTPINAGHFP